MAFSRLADHRKRYVQDLMRERGDLAAELLANPRTHIYVCGLKGMEDGVIEALHDISREYMLDWVSIHNRLKHEGRIHLETY